MDSLLIVDDQIEVHEELEQMLLDMDFGFSRILHASNAADALNLLRHHSPGILLLDVVLPGADGFTVFQQLLENKSDTAVIIMTGFPQLDYALKAIRLKASGFLVKPIVREELQATILEILKGGSPAQKKQLDLHKHHQLYFRMLDEYLTSAGSEMNFEKISANTGLDRLITPFIQILIARIDQSKPDSGNPARIASRFADLGMPSIFYTRADNSVVFIIGQEKRPDQKALDQLERILHQHFEHYAAGMAIGDSGTGIRNIYSQTDFALKYACEQHIFQKLVIYNRLNIAAILAQRHSARITDAFRNHREERFEESIDLLFIDFMQNRIQPADAAEVLERSWLKLGIKLPELRQADTIQTLRLLLVSRLRPLLQNETEQSLPGKIEQILAYIAGHYQQDLDLNLVANQMNMGYCYASTVFKRHVGMSFSQFLNNYRMDKALDLLENTNCFVYEVAGKVGFSSNKYFFLKFKELYGMTPGDYQKKALSKMIGRG